MITPFKWGRDGALVESITFNQRVVGSTPALASRRDRGQVLCLQLQDLKECYRNGRNEVEFSALAGGLDKSAGPILLRRGPGICSYPVGFFGTPCGMTVPHDVSLAP